MADVSTPYDLDFDRAAHLLVVRWYRMFSPGDVETYGQEYTRGFVAAQFRSGYRLLMDMTPCDAQPQESLALFAAHMKKIPKASRIGVAATAPLLRGQVRRIMTQPYMRLFESPVDARTWVTA
ncbi:hypothetical protein [Sphingomonas endophytica]|uniref:STAS/SEC14 domain-containing protein n=1 Tax=Sphingomonas endophytica TaxID=869719 RepID=A0A147I4T5_9SPHN|nr:hypothetical protein [Sphingomonas endophytica]KTT73464.1 hypothetical protein NS334_07510 [Sphingomonas endophytica]